MRDDPGWVWSFIIFMGIYIYIYTILSMVTMIFLPGVLDLVLLRRQEAPTLAVLLCPRSEDFFCENSPNQQNTRVYQAVGGLIS